MLVIHVLVKLQISLVDTSRDQLLKIQKGKGSYGVLKRMQQVCPWFNLHQLTLKFIDFWLSCCTRYRHPWGGKMLSHLFATSQRMWIHFGYHPQTRCSLWRTIWCKCKGNLKGELWNTMVVSLLTLIWQKVETRFDWLYWGLMLVFERNWLEWM